MVGHNIFNKPIIFVWCVCCCYAVCHSGNYTISIIAGVGKTREEELFELSGIDGPANTSRLIQPTDVVVDANGSVIFTDATANVILRIGAASPGILSLVAGNASLPGGFNGNNVSATSALLDRPIGLAVDGQGRLLFAETFGNVVRRLDFSTGIVTVIAGRGGTSDGASPGDGGLAVDAALLGPNFVVVDAADNVYFSELGGFRVRRIDAETGIITTVAGNGQQTLPNEANGDGALAINATLGMPAGLALDREGSLYICDFDRVRKVTNPGSPTAIITTVVGGGDVEIFDEPNLDAADARLASANDIAFDVANNLYVADIGFSRVYRVDRGSNVITRLAGAPLAGPDQPSIVEGPARETQLDVLSGITVDGDGSVYLADYGNAQVYKLVCSDD